MQKNSHTYIQRRVIEFEFEFAYRWMLFGIYKLHESKTRRYTKDYTHIGAVRVGNKGNIYKFLLQENLALQSPITPTNSP